MATTGEKPGIGVYMCLICSQTIILFNGVETLPPCPKCHGSEFQP